MFHLFSPNWPTRDIAVTPARSGASNLASPEPYAEQKRPPRMAEFFKRREAAKAVMYRMGPTDPKGVA